MGTSEPARVKLSHQRGPAKSVRSQAFLWRRFQQADASLQGLRVEYRASGRFEVDKAIADFETASHIDEQTRVHRPSLQDGTR